MVCYKIKQLTRIVTLTQLQKIGLVEDYSEYNLELMEIVDIKVSGV